MLPDIEVKSDCSKANRNQTTHLHLSDVTTEDPGRDEDRSHLETTKETEETKTSECKSDVSTQQADRETESDAVDDQSGSGEFVVTMLAKAKLEEQGIGVKGRSSPLLEAGIEESPSFKSHRDEDVTAESWRQHRKHIFVLSEAGKPIYSRYGSEEALSSTMGVMMALVSFVQSGDNVIRSVYSGEYIKQQS